MAIEAPTEAYPLRWPAHWKRTHSYSRKRSKFGVKSTHAASALLMDEMRKMRCTNIIVSSNLHLKPDGHPYARQPALDADAGVAVYFKLKGEPMVIACDQYSKSWENLVALAKTVENLRGIDRWGCSELMRQAFTGFAALPPVGGTTSNEVWFTVLGVSENAPAEVVEAAYKALLKKVHPDIPITGDAQKFTSVQAAWNRFQQLIRA